MEYCINDIIRKVKEEANRRGYKTVLVSESIWSEYSDYTKSAMIDEMLKSNVSGRFAVVCLVDEPTLDWAREIASAVPDSSTDWNVLERLLIISDVPTSNKTLIFFNEEEQIQ